MRVVKQYSLYNMKNTGLSSSYSKVYSLETIGQGCQGVHELGLETKKNKQTGKHIIREFYYSCIDNVQENMDFKGTSFPKKIFLVFCGRSANYGYWCDRTAPQHIFYSILC